MNRIRDAGLIIPWAPLFINHREKDLDIWWQTVNSDCDMRGGEQCRAKIFFLFFFFHCLLLIPHAAWLSPPLSLRRDSSRTCTESQSSWQTSPRRENTKWKNALNLISPPLYFGYIRTEKALSSPPLFNHLVHLLSLFHSGVAVKSYPIYRHSECIIVRSIQMVGPGDENSQYSTHCKEKRTGTVPTDQVFPS